MEFSKKRGKEGKRGQIALVALIGVIVVFVVVLLFFLSGRISEVYFEKAEVKEAREEIGIEIEKCLVDVLNDGLLVVGKQGGYYQLPSEPDESVYSFALEANVKEENAPLVFFVDYAPFYFYLGESKMPDLEFVQGQLSLYVQENIGDCLFFAFNRGGLAGRYKIDFDVGDVTVWFDEERGKRVTNAKLELDGSVTLGDGTVFGLSGLKKGIGFDFAGKYGVVEEIIEEQSKNPDYMPLGFVMDLAYREGFEIELRDIEGKEGDDFYDVLYILYFGEETIFAEEGYYPYVFAIRYKK